MAIRKKAPKGISQAEWNKVRTIYALIDNDVIMKDPMMASYTDASSYSSNKAKGVKQFVKFYHDMYPAIFKKGKAGSRLEKYISSQRGRVEIKSQLEKYQDEGLLDLPDVKFSLQQKEASIQDLNLSGGIFKALEGKEDPFSKADRSIEGALYPLALPQTGAQANYYEMLVGTDTSDEENPRVKFETLSGLLADNKLAGPVRVLAAQYIKDIKFGASNLMNQVNTQNTLSMTREINRSTRRKVSDLLNKAISLSDIIVSQNVEVDSDTMIAYDKMPQVLPQGFAMTVAGLRNAMVAGSSSEASAASMEIGLSSAMALVSGQIGGNPAGNAWTAARRKMIESQSMSIYDLRQAVVKRELYDRTAIARQLREVYQQARTMKNSGGLTEQQYKSAERDLMNIRKQADSLPTPGQLIDSLDDGDVSRIRDAQYKSMIINTKLTNLMTELSTASSVATAMRQLKLDGFTAQSAVDRLTKLYNAVSEVLLIKPEDLKVDFPTITSSALAGAKAAVRAVQSALTKAKRSGLEGALHAYLYLKERKDKQFGENLKVAFTLSSSKTSTQMANVVRAQNTGLQSARTTATDRVVKFYMAGTPYMLNTFMRDLSQGAQNKINAATALLSDEKLNKYFGSDSMPRFTEFDQDPRKVLSSLPNKVKNMSRTQAAAMAKAISPYLNGLFNRFTTVINTQQQMMMGGASFPQLQKTRNRQIDLLVEMLKDAKLDSSNLMKELPKHSAGLHFIGFMPKAESTGGMKPTIAIVSPDDLLTHQIFKGDTYISNEGRGGQFDRQGFPINKKYSMTKTVDGVSYLARRPITDAMGQTKLIDWNPMDAQDLRNKYFIAMYPYDLRNTGLNRLYQDELSKNKKVDSVSTSDVLVEFGLESGGSANRW
jgi:hypothetical protein